MSSINTDPEYVAALEEKLRELKTTLGLANQTLTITFKLPPSQTDLMGLLLNSEHVTPDMIQQRLEIAANAKVAIHRLRTHLKMFHTLIGISEKEELIRSRRSIGYWIEPDHKRKIRALLAPAEQPSVAVETAPEPAVEAA